MKNSKFDQQIFKAFEAFEPTPPVGLWENIAQNIRTEPLIDQVPEASSMAGQLTPFIKNIILAVSGVAVIGTVSYVAFTYNKNTIDVGENKAYENKVFEDKTVDETRDDIQSTELGEKNDTSPPIPGNGDNIKSEKGEKQSSVNRDKGILINANIAGNYHDPDAANGDEKSKLNEDRNTKEETTFIAPRQMTDTFICPGVTLLFYWPNNNTAHLLVDNRRVAQISRSGRVSYDFSERGQHVVAWESEGKIYATRNVNVFDVRAAFSALPFGEGRFQFINNSVGMKHYFWNFGDEAGASIEFEPVYQYKASTRKGFKIELRAESNEGCKDNAEMEINNPRLIEVKKPQIPNVFTPGNGDGLNDRFMVKIENETEFYLLITDLGGNMVFESHNKFNGWNGNKISSGEPCPGGSYIVTLRYRQIDSEPITERVKLTLIR